MQGSVAAVLHIGAGVAPASQKPKVVSEQSSRASTKQP
jgi:hypothetical protein